ncbi:MAG: BamA/TamA family outer membrane protein, partial [Muribaculum sp.]|nr:BamA/TamA family outer membrane protein [Muribaculum sp.]
LDSKLRSEGYFRGEASYEIIPGKKNKRKAQISYTINPGEPYMVSDIQLLDDTTAINAVIDSLARRVPYLASGGHVRYSVDSLVAARTAIANGMRTCGYYFFRPEYIEYLADSTIHARQIAVRLTLASNTPPLALRRYRTGNVTLHLNRWNGKGRPDTFQTRRATVIQQRPSHFRRALVPSCLTFRSGRVFSVNDMNNTQAYLSRLGIFSSIVISAIPDTTATDPTLDVDVYCTFDQPMEVSFEANLSSKSNSYIGPGFSLGITNRNIFGGGEQLHVGVTGSYEWQTGHRANADYNSYEAGINASLAFPRMIAPWFVKRNRKNLNWTRFAISADALSRPHYFRLAQFSASMNYDWKMRKYFSYTFTPLKLTYMKLIKTTAVFDSIMDANRAVQLSFRNQLIPQMGWSMTYDRTMNRDNLLNVQVSVTEAGNICWALWRLGGVKGEKKVFGMPFSQFVRGQAQAVYSRRLTGEHWIVSRFLIGAAHAYGNATEVPYSEQFYIGGANSIRAFSVRSIGPGSYHPEGNNANSYFDETGTFKLEMNVEYRFPLFGPLHGAVFLDAGNVWLLQNDPLRPGGQLESSTFLKEIALGTGLGLRVDLGMIVLRGDLGIALHDPYETGKRGYYNIPKFGKGLAFHLAIGYPF